MKNMDKGFTVPKWMLIVQSKISQMIQNLSARFVCPSPKVLDFNGKMFYWESIVCGYYPFKNVKLQVQTLDLVMDHESTLFFPN